MNGLFEKPPAPPPVPTMPDPMSPATLEARRQTIAEAAEGGRQSTILTNAQNRASGTLAGQTYGSTKTGAT